MVLLTVKEFCLLNMNPISLFRILGACRLSFINYDVPNVAECPYLVSIFLSHFSIHVDRGKSWKIN